MRSIRPMWAGGLSSIMGSMATTTATRTADLPDVSLRLARRDERGALRRLAALDSARAPEGRVLVADVDGELWAARSLEDLHTVADPFRPTGDLVALLAERGRQLVRAEAGPQAEVRFAARPSTCEP